MFEEELLLLETVLVSIFTTLGGLTAVSMIIKTALKRLTTKAIEKIQIAEDTNKLNVETSDKLQRGLINFQENVDVKIDKLTQELYLVSQELKAFRNDVADILEESYFGEDIEDIEDDISNDDL